MKNGLVKTYGYPLLGWALFFGLIIAFVSSTPEIGGGTRFFSPSFLLFVVVYTALFYVNALALIPRLYLRKKFLPYFVCIAACFAGFYFLRPFDRLVLLHNNTAVQGPPPAMREPPRGSLPDRPPPGRMESAAQRQNLDIVSVVLFIAVWSASSVTQLLRQWRQTERRAMQAEADKMAAELSFLKAQINPHFLFNTLNNIYSLAIVKSEATADAVLKLSHILHYVTDDVRHDFVPLQSEVDCAHNYIELQKLRLSKKVTVEFELTGRVADKQVPPLVFMTFIENAFKYGISNHKECMIQIRIDANERGTRFFCRNKVFYRDEAERQGIGIANAEKRLAYLYGSKHSLRIDTEDDSYSVTLSIIN